MRFVSTDWVKMQAIGMDDATSRVYNADTWAPLGTEEKHLNHTFYEQRAFRNILARSPERNGR